jgi:hypothetical protein
LVIRRKAKSSSGSGGRATFVDKAGFGFPFTVTADFSGRLSKIIINSKNFDDEIFNIF